MPNAPPPPPPPPLEGGVALVVDVNVPDTPPTVSVVVVSVEGAEAAVCLTHTVCPLLIVPGVVENVSSAPQPIENSPLTTLILAGLLMPEMVMGLEVTVAPVATPV